MQGNLFAAINQASGGVRFGDTVTISAEAVTRSEKDAQALVDVVNSSPLLVQSNRQGNPAAGQVATLLDSLQTSTAGNTTTISLAIPEQQLEQLLNSARSESRQSRPCVLIRRPRGSHKAKNLNTGRPFRSGTVSIVCFSTEPLERSRYHDPVISAGPLAGTPPYGRSRRLS